MHWQQMKRPADISSAGVSRSPWSSVVDVPGLTANSGTFRFMVVALLSVLIAGCLSTPVAESPPPAAEVPFFQPVREVRHQPREQHYEVGREKLQTQAYRTPKVEVKETVADIAAENLVADLQGEPISVNYHNLPLPNFINEVFGEKLGLSFTLSPELRKKKDLVTLRVTERVPPQELFRVARITLEAYGVSISREGELLVFRADNARRGGQPPLLVSGRALPEVPDSQRPVFMFVPLEVVSNTKVRGWLSDLLKGRDLQIKEDPIRNAIVLQGKPAQIEQALSIIKSLDQPLMRGKFSLALEPAYAKVDDLAVNLENILKSEGIDASRRPPLGTVILLPLKGSNTLVIFAPNQQTIEHVRKWVETIDRKQQLSVDKGIFTYKVNNTQAQYIVDMLNGLGAADGQVAQVTGKQATAAAANSAGGHFVVDENRNAIVFRGSGQEWLDLLPVVKQMDQSAPTVLIEVLLAEVTLTDNEATGFEFLANPSAKVDGKTYGINLGTLGGLGVGGAGFTAVLDSAGATKAILNLFYENKRAEIRSRPRLLVKSGHSATIDVGTEIPIISRNQQTTDAANAPVIQDVQYRKTGVRLNIRPIVHASGFVDVEIEQELSEAQPNSSSGIDSPSIFNRTIQTVATLRDGGSLVLGGLISRTRTKGKTGMPGLSDAPLVGRLFSSDTDNVTRTELMVMIVPYVMTEQGEGEKLTEDLVKQLSLF